VYDAEPFLAAGRTTVFAESQWAGFPSLDAFVHCTIAMYASFRLPKPLQLTTTDCPFVRCRLGVAFADGVAAYADPPPVNNPIAIAAAGIAKRIFETRISSS
jgi:hypothetical protein